MDETRRDIDETWRLNSERPDGAVPYAAPEESGDGTTLRFGPGVPAEVARKWRGAALRRSLTRRIAGGLLTLGLALLVGLVVWWLLRGGPGVTVTGASVSAPSTPQPCDTTVRVVGTIRTNGGHGEITYRWRRSDGQVSGVLSESVRKGQRSVQVPLRWTVKGPGTLHATATLEIVTPKAPIAMATGAFDYICE
ncbi:hypothetical protein NE236_34660 [Actinoallomurus purpureus]|uniref:hypothetical protein n=1 Tax=Actinoallomurus purpureus TaxID=478114 RepID=UPI0020936529|nr:hypothetical protein [Actinoallomurus purpureus]MCO6010122.1 hypothetical protein [Actinoallomurus purpureus]